MFPFSRFLYDLISSEPFCIDKFSEISFIRIPRSYNPPYVYPEAS